MKITRKRIIIAVSIVLFVAVGGLLWWWIGCPGLAHLVDRPPGNWTDEDSCYQRLPEDVPKAVVTVKANDAATGKPLKEFFVRFEIRRYRSTLPAHSHTPRRRFRTVVSGVNGVARFEVPVFKGSLSIFNTISYRGRATIVAREYIPIMEDKSHPELNNTVVNFKVKLKPLNPRAPDNELIVAADACYNAHALFPMEPISSLETVVLSPLTITDRAERVKRLGIAQCYIEALLANWRILHKDEKRFYWYYREGDLIKVVWRPGNPIPDSGSENLHCLSETGDEFLNDELSEIERLLTEITKPKTDK